MVTFFSNHADTTFIERYLGQPVTFIRHPFLLPEWTVEDIERDCSKQIIDAVKADRLVINGDYTLVAIILKKRWELGKKTGFIAMEKDYSKSEAVKDDAGRIRHTNVLTPIGVRWV